jgi:M-phase inducer tyrosine phosphatase
METMEMSPLPHKAPFCTSIEIASPTPLMTPSCNEDDTDMVLDSPAPISRQSSLEAASRPVIVEYVCLNLLPFGLY